MSVVAGEADPVEPTVDDPVSDIEGDDCSNDHEECLVDESITYCMIEDDSEDETAPRAKRARMDDDLPPARHGRVLDLGVNTTPLDEFFASEIDDDLHGPGFTAFVREYAAHFGIPFAAMRQRVANVLMGSTIITSKTCCAKDASVAAFMADRFRVSSQKYEIQDCNTMWRLDGGSGSGVPMVRTETAGLGQIHITISTFFSTSIVIPVVDYLRAIAAMHMEECRGTPRFLANAFEGLAYFRGVLDSPPADNYHPLQMPRLFTLPGSICAAHAIAVRDGQVARACAVSGALAASLWLQKYISNTHAHVRPDVHVHVLDHLLVLVGAPIEIFKLQLLLVGNAQRALTYTGRARNVRFRQSKTVISLDVSRIAAAVTQWCIKHRERTGTQSLLIAAFWLAFSAFDAALECKITTNESLQAVYWRIRGCQTLHDARIAFETTFARKHSKVPPVQQVAPENWRHAHGAVSCVCERDGLLDRVALAICSDASCACRGGTAAAPEYATLGDIPCLCGVTFDECIMISLPLSTKRSK